MAAEYSLAWNELCDWYLEAAKERLRAGDPTAQDVAYFCLDTLLRMLHPFMPFLTEELWSRTPGHVDYLMLSPWPEPDGRFVDLEAEQSFGEVMTIVEEVRGHRQAAGAPPRGGSLHLEQPVERAGATLAPRLAWGELVGVMEGGTPLSSAPARGTCPSSPRASRPAEAKPEAALG